MSSAAPISHSSALPVPAWVWVLLIAAGLVASATDLHNMRIPNWLTLPLLALGLVYWAVAAGGTGLLHALGGAALASVIFIGVYVVAGGGAGDAKLMMALGAWVGTERAVVLVLAVTMIGLVQGLIVTGIRGGVRDIPLVILHYGLNTRIAFARMLTGRMPSTRAQPSSEPTPTKRHKGWFPYAPSILLGTVAAWWYWERYGAIV